MKRRKLIQMIRRFVKKKFIMRLVLDLWIEIIDVLNHLSATKNKIHYRYSLIKDSVKNNNEETDVELDVFSYEPERIPVQFLNIQVVD
jgi:hypothetical protein